VTAERVEEGDGESWHAEWRRTAERVAACVALDHIHDLWHASTHGTPRLAAVVSRAPDRVVDGLARPGARVSLQSRWLRENARWLFDVDSASELGRTLLRYSLSGVAGRIACPTPVLAGEDDHVVPVGLAREFADELTAPTTLRVFRTEEGAGEHCRVGNPRLATNTIYDWLDGTLSGAGEARTTRARGRVADGGRRLPRTIRRARVPRRPDGERRTSEQA
jgi:pimeloyl-ACP methyl ester carboxylesterase